MLLFITIFLTSYLYHGLGITVGYHRILAHRALKVPRLLEYFIVSGGYLCFEGSPIAWVTTHRIHHKTTDKEGDPHSPRNGFWHAFVGWLFDPSYKSNKDQFAIVAPDLRRDPVYRLFDPPEAKVQWLVCLGICLAFRLLLFLTLGPWAVLANLLAAGTVFVAAFLVNSVCHLPRFGYRAYETADESRNVWWVGLLALGEGWHNNHHAMPQSARHGLTWYEPDISWWAIWLLRQVGLARNVRLPAQKAEQDKIGVAMESLAYSKVINSEDGQA
ncbi:MAG TPA: fatty acid desaturase [Candidatus Obscuribacterales bacterium]